LRPLDVKVERKNGNYQINEIAPLTGKKAIVGKSLTLKAGLKNV
jgi:hypothetical protein